MHRLNTTSTSLDEIVEAVDLRQPPGDVVILSFADSDLSALAVAWALEQHALPSVRLAHLRDLRHPMSVGLPRASRPAVRSCPSSSIGRCYLRAIQVPLTP